MSTRGLRWRSRVSGRWFGGKGADRFAWRPIRGCSSPLTPAPRAQTLPPSKAVVPFMTHWGDLSSYEFAQKVGRAIPQLIAGGVTVSIAHPLPAPPPPCCARTSPLPAPTAPMPRPEMPPSTNPPHATPASSSASTALARRGMLQHPQTVTQQLPPPPPPPPLQHPLFTPNTASTPGGPGRHRQRGERAQVCGAAGPRPSPAVRRPHSSLLHGARWVLAAPPPRRGLPPAQALGPVHRQQASQPRLTAGASGGVAGFTPGACSPDCTTWPPCPPSLLLQASTPGLAALTPPGGPPCPPPLLLQASTRGLRPRWRSAATPSCCPC
jgi:hypothetical protein